MSSSVNTLEAVKLQQNETKVLSDIISQFIADENPLINLAPTVGIDGTQYEYLRTEVLPNSAFRAINGQALSQSGSRKRLSESLAIMSGDIDVDVFLMRQAAGAAIRAAEVRDKSQAMALDHLRTFFKGNTAVVGQENEFDGLQTRLSDPAFSGQVLDAGTTSGGDPLSFHVLDKAIGLTRGGNRALLVAKDLFYRFAQALRNSAVSGIQVALKEGLGDQPMTYNGIPLIPIDRDQAGSIILPFDEPAPVGGQAQTNSVYCVNFEIGGTYMIGGNGGIQITAPYTMDNGNIERTHIEWYTNFVIHDIRSVSRLRGITDAPFVA
jgi:hypothetical protein